MSEMLLIGKKGVLVLPYQGGFKWKGVARMSDTYETYLVQFGTEWMRRKLAGAPFTLDTGSSIEVSM